MSLESLLRREVAQKYTDPAQREVWLRRLDKGEPWLKEIGLYKGELKADGDSTLWEGLVLSTSPTEAAKAVARRPLLAGVWARSLLAGAARPRGVASVTALPPEQREPIARLLLHVATCHLYALAPPPAPLWPTEAAMFGGGGSSGGGSDSGGVNAAGIRTSDGDSAQRAAPGKWPYDEPCCEPLFAALSVRQQFVLMSEVLIEVWCPGGGESRETPLHAAALLALIQLGGIHAVAEARGQPPPALLLQTRSARALQALLQSRNFRSLVAGRWMTPGSTDPPIGLLLGADPPAEKQPQPAKALRSWLALQRHAYLAVPAVGRLAREFGQPLLQPLAHVLWSAIGAVESPTGLVVPPRGRPPPPATMAALGALLSEAVAGCCPQVSGREGDDEPWGGGGSERQQRDQQEQSQQAPAVDAGAVRRLSTALEALTGGLLAQLRRECADAGVPPDAAAVGLLSLERMQRCLLLRLPAAFGLGSTISGAAAGRGGGGGGGGSGVSPAETLQQGVVAFLGAVQTQRAALLAEALPEGDSLRLHVRPRLGRCRAQLDEMAGLAGLAAWSRLRTVLHEIRVEARRVEGLMGSDPFDRIRALRRSALAPYGSAFADRVSALLAQAHAAAARGRDARDWQNAVLLAVELVECMEGVAIVYNNAQLGQAAWRSEHRAAARRSRIEAHAPVTQLQPALSLRAVRRRSQGGRVAELRAAARLGDRKDGSPLRLRGGSRSAAGSVGSGDASEAGASGSDGDDQEWEALTIDFGSEAEGGEAGAAGEEHAQAWQQQSQGQPPPLPPPPQQEQPSPPWRGEGDSLDASSGGGSGSEEDDEGSGSTLRVEEASAGLHLQPLRPLPQGLQYGRYGATGQEPPLATMPPPRPSALEDDFGFLAGVEGLFEGLGGAGLGGGAGLSPLPRSGRAEDAAWERLPPDNGPGGEGALTEEQLMQLMNDDDGMAALAEYGFGADLRRLGGIDPPSPGSVSDAGSSGGDSGAGGDAGAAGDDGSIAGSIAGSFADLGTTRWCARTARKLCMVELARVQWQQGDLTAPSLTGGAACALRLATVMWICAWATPGARPDGSPASSARAALHLAGIPSGDRPTGSSVDSDGRGSSSGSDDDDGGSGGGGGASTSPFGESKAWASLRRGALKPLRRLATGIQKSVFWLDAVGAEGLPAIEKLDATALLEIKTAIALLLRGIRLDVRDTTSCAAALTARVVRDVCSAEFLQRIEPNAAATAAREGSSGGGGGGGGGGGAKRRLQGAAASGGGGGGSSSGGGGGRRRAARVAAATEGLFDSGALQARAAAWCAEAAARVLALGEGVQLFDAADAAACVAPLRQLAGLAQAQVDAASSGGGGGGGGGGGSSGGGAEVKASSLEQAEELAAAASELLDIVCSAAATERCAQLGRNTAEELASGPASTLAYFGHRLLEEPHLERLVAAAADVGGCSVRELEDAVVELIAALEKANKWGRIAEDVSRGVAEFVRAAAPVYGCMVRRLVSHACKLRKQLKQQPNQPEIAAALDAIAYLPQLREALARATLRCFEGHHDQLPTRWSTADLLECMASLLPRDGRASAAAAADDEGAEGEGADPGLELIGAAADFLQLMKDPQTVSAWPGEPLAEQREPRGGGAPPDSADCGEESQLQGLLDLGPWGVVSEVDPLHELGPGLREEPWEAKARALDALLMGWEARERAAARARALGRLYGVPLAEDDAARLEAEAVDRVRAAADEPAGAGAGDGDGDGALLAVFGQRWHVSNGEPPALEARRGVYCSREEAAADACIRRARELVSADGADGAAAAALDGAVTGGLRRLAALEPRVMRSKEELTFFNILLLAEGWAATRVVIGAELVTALATSHARLAASPGKHAAKVHKDGAAAGLRRILHVNPADADALLEAAFGGTPQKSRGLLIDALAPLHAAALRGHLQTAGVERDGAAAAADADPRGKASHLYRCAALSLGLAAFRAPAAYRDLLGPHMAGSGGRSGQAADLVRRQHARAAAASMAEDDTPAAAAKAVLTLQALRAAACAGKGKGHPAGDCLDELAVHPDRPLPPHLAEGEEAWRACRAAGLRGPWTLASMRSMPCEAFVAETLSFAARGMVAADAAAGVGGAEASAIRAACLTGARDGAATAHAARAYGRMRNCWERMCETVPELRAIGFAPVFDRVHGSSEAPLPSLGAEAVEILKPLWREELEGLDAAALARRAQLLLMQAGWVSDAHALGPWCALATEFHSRLIAARGGFGGKEDEEKGADYKPDDIVNAAWTAASAVGQDALLAAAPWFHGDHVAHFEEPAGAAGCCDWCGAEVRAARLGCDACGCAGYCGAGCAAEAARHHARNCWRLRLLAQPRAAKRGAADLTRQLFEYGDEGTG